MSLSRNGLRNEINDLREARLVAMFKSLAADGRAVTSAGGTGREGAEGVRPLLSCEPVAPGGVSD